MGNQAGSVCSTYSRTAILLHWGIAALVLTTIPIGWYGAAYDTDRAQAAIGLHKSIGMIILALSLVRTGWRLSHRPPPLPTTIAPALRWAARATHTAFYVLLLVLPLSGWWMTSADHDRDAFGFGPFAVPFLPVPRGEASAGPAHFVHTNLAWLMMGLVTLHIVAVLKHILFDDEQDIVARMLPAPD
ncbi:cytochrome b [Novosphingobium sp. Gsoil 351]|uniref:cytochrome b n=1 Tax=Novosphingobium sp. Gsoil 351 TaxID=2675225 RepID=UPI0012B4B666|nr:cytochrome b [Novosphingobium sp. Gsoil 351]QGN54998.1 cytochrome b [Novosphingobium sp. Gsoil 351]